MVYFIKIDMKKFLIGIGYEINLISLLKLIIMKNLYIFIL